MEQRRIPDLIFDVGMHVGNDAEFYLKKGFRVIGVEANPDLCALAERRLASYVASGQLTIVNRAIAPRAGEVTFHVNLDDPESEWGTLNNEWVDRNARWGAPSRAITVRASRFEDLLREHGVPRYLKIDIEGSDLLCVEALASFSVRPRFVSLETSKTSFDELVHELSVLWDLGYRRYKVVSQQWMKLWRCPSPAREGKYVNHRFPAASSGLFGEELPGRWLDIEETLRRYLRIFRSYRRYGDGSRVRRLLPWDPTLRVLNKLSGWHDLHAMAEDDVAGGGREIEDPVRDLIRLPER